MSTMRRRSSKRGINRGTQSTSTKRGINRGTQSTSENTSSFDIQKQLSNYKTRLGDASEEATDTRNPIEKALNLKKDQNVLFDIFELLGRPQQALFGAIDAGQKGKDIGKGALKGLTGEKETSGKQLLKNAGMKDRKGKLDVSDVLGFGLDVFADPMDVPLIPVKGVTAAGKVLGKADNVADVARSAGKAADVADAARTATKFISPSEGVFRLVGKGAKGAAKLTDKGVEKVLGNIDAKQLRNVEKVASETGQTTADIIKQVGKSDLLGNYRSLKKGITNTLDSSKMVGGLTGKARRSANSVELADAVSRKRLEQLENMSSETAKKLGIDPSKLSEDLSKILESEQATKIVENKSGEIEKLLKDADGLSWLNKLSKDDNVFEGTEESVTALRNFIQDKAPSIKFKQSSTPTRLVIDTKKSKFLDDFKSNKDIREAISKLDLKKDLGYNAAEIKELEGLKKTFASNKDLSNLLETHRKGYSDIADAYKNYAGVDLDFARRKGYVRKAQGDLQKDASDILKSDITGNIRGQGLVNEKTFGAREYDSGLVANRLKQEQLAKQIGGVAEDGTVTVGKLQKRSQNLERKLSFNRKAELEAAKANVTDSLEKAKNFNINASKLKEREFKIRDSIAKNGNILTETQNKLNNSTLKRINSIKDVSLHSNFSQHTKQLNKYTKEYNSIIEKMSAKDVSDEALKGFTKQSSQLEGRIRKLNAQIDGDLARINGYVDKKTLTQINQTNNALKKAEGLGQRSKKLDDALNKTLDKQNILKQSNANTVSALENRVKNLDLQLGAINPEKDAEIYKELEKIQNKISILESNEGKELFNLNYHAGMKDFIDNATQYSKGAKVYNDALVYGTFKNPEYVREFKEGMEVPRGFVKVNGSKLRDQFEAVKGILPDNSDSLEMLGKEFSGKTMLLDKDFANLINVNRKSKEQANALVKVIDSFNNTFKKYKIMTPGFQVRNIAGNATNMVLSGMPAGQIPEYYKKATNVLNSAEDLLDKASRQVALTGKDADNWRLLQQFYDGGFKEAGTKLQDLEQLRSKVAGKKGPLNWLTKKNAKINESMDSLNRMALLMYANDHPKYVQKLGKSNAIEAVKYALMDPSNMSDFEKRTMKKIVPFYTFTKQNLLYQASNMMKNTPKYNRLMKAINAAYDNLDENSYFQYQKEGMQIPIPFAKDSKGNQLFLKANLPLADLGEFMSNPLQKTLASTSPLIRTPFEMATGKDIYSGRDSNYNTISNLVESATGKPLSSGVKNATGKAEQILSGLGVDTISTNVLKKVTAAINKYNGNMDDQAMWAEIFRSILQNTNQEKVEQSKAYDDLERYQSYIKSLKNQGIEVPTIRELNNQSKRTLRNAKNRRAKRNRY